MKPRENQSERLIQNGTPSKLRRRAIDQSAVGSIILLWGSLLILKQIGIIEKNVSILPFLLTAFGLLLVVGGIYRLREVKRRQGGI